MKLVIEAEHVQQVRLQVGNIEIPLTREQVVELLFGEGVSLASLVSKKKAKANGHGKAHVNGAASPKRGDGGASVMAARRAKGLCIRCEKKAVEGRAYCAPHLEAAKNNAMKARRAHAKAERVKAEAKS